MKTIKLFAATVIGAAVLGLAFKGKESEYKLNTKSSEVSWLAKKVGGEHSGKIGVSKGTLMVEGTAIKSGNIEMDINTITCTDITDAGYNEKMVSHLKNKDFFFLEKFATATFVISSSVDKGSGAYDLIGKMTIKGVTQDITIPVNVTVKDKTLAAVGKVMIDRTKFDIKYGSKNFFEGIADKAIEDEFSLDFKIVASM